MKSKFAFLAALSACLPVAGSPAIAAAPPAMPSAAEIINQRDEALAYAAGLQGYIYGYPALDYMRIMREQTTPGLDPKGVYAPVNGVYFQNALVEPGSLYAGRGPNTDTIYFTGWLDLSQGPVTVDAPDTHDRYYALTFADFYSEVQHTGRRTTGTGAQRLMVAGPEWQGDVPAGVQLIRMRTHQAYILGRVLVEGPKDFPAASKLMRQFKLSSPAAAASAQRDYPVAADLTTLSAFRFINAFLRTNPRLPGEEALMAQFDKAGFGPNVSFDAAKLSPGTRRGSNARWPMATRFCNVPRARRRSSRGGARWVRGRGLMATIICPARSPKRTASLPMSRRNRSILRRLPMGKATSLSAPSAIASCFRWGRCRRTTRSGRSMPMTCARST